MSLLLSTDSISKTYGLHTLFQGISLSLHDGEHTGLIGPNGSGKSTLLRILAAIEPPDEGSLTSRRNLRLAFVPQHDAFPDAATVEQVLLSALADQPIDEHDRLARARIMLSKVGFPNPDQLASSLSGGWKKRLAIAHALLRDPELLLLDEPTNHLDLEGIEWLENLLKSASFSCLVVSHDRYFLENLTNRVIELNRAFPDGYFSIDGSYSTFLEKREEFLQAQAAQQASLAGRVRREIEWLKRGAKARTTKAKGRIQHAHEMMSELADLKMRNAQGKTAAIDFSSTDRKTRKLLVAKDVSITLGNRLLFQDLNLIISPNMKLGLLGPNGSGKTTLLRLLTGELAPDSGDIRRADALRIVRFDQHRQQLDLSQTLRNALSPKSDTVTYRDAKMHITSWAKRFLFRTEQLDLPLSSLSGGEQARVLIANLMLQPADLLLLDEPTNDLDIPTLEVLEESLEDFPGAVVLVTHDRYMLDRLSTDLLGLDGQSHANLYADYTQYERAQQQAQAAPSPKSEPKNQKSEAKSPNTPPPGLKRLTYMEQREWEQIESKIMSAEEALSAAQQEMENPSVLADREKLTLACEKLTSAQQLVQSLYTRWEYLDAKQKA